MNSNTEVKLKTIADIENENVAFYIDAYQRGYRWTEAEVRNLLEDIYEFSQSGYKNPQDSTKDKMYCLQPIVVTKMEENSAWKVIDGQQRLTTIYLIYLYYYDPDNFLEVPFQLHYNEKSELEKCLEELKDKSYRNLDKLSELSKKYEENIDCFFIINAYKEICTYFAKIRSNAHIRSRFNDMKTVFDNYMEIIWYELLNCDPQKEIAMFTQINVGKIPLTNAELIKALLLRATDNEMTPYQQNIAVKWDEMEAQLSESNFWSFLVNDQDVYTTRIDFIFEIKARKINENILRIADEEDANGTEKYYIEQAYNRQYFSFYVFNNYAKYLKKKKPDESYIEIIWGEVEDYFRMFRDWYRKRNWYHLIGFIVATSGRSYLNTLSDLTSLYEKGSNSSNTAGYKTLFEANLRQMIIDSIPAKKESGKLKVSDFIEYLGNLKYNSKDSEIKMMLLLYNISTLELLADQTDVKFPFDKYKNKDMIWDIEHINAVADERPYDSYDAPGNKCLIWLENVCDLPEIDKLKTSDGKDLIELVNKVIKEKLYLPKNEANLASFVKVYETVINAFGESDDRDDKIHNLTLLDSGTNRSYKNDVFPLKRKKILENCTKEVFIPICTRNVFLKAYKGSTNLVKWTNTDKTNYFEDMVECISKYLRMEDDRNGQ